MALFIVNRYLGEDASPSTVSDKPSIDNADLILQKLKAEAEKRRQEKVTCNIAKQICNEVTTSSEQTNEQLTVTEHERKSAKLKRKKNDRLSKNLDGNKQNNVKAEEVEDKISKIRRKIKCKKVKIEEQTFGVNVRETRGDNSVQPESDSSQIHVEDGNCSEKRNGSDNDGSTLETSRVTENEDHVSTVKEGHSDKTHEQSGYTVLGEFKPKFTEKVKRVLPEWLSKPSIVSADIRQDQIPISEVAYLHHTLVDKLKQNGIFTFFPVQAQIVPVMLETLRLGQCGAGGYPPSDICCSAPTGSGKTLAFVLPIVQALQERVVCQIRALIVLPVQDLARQVFKVFQTYTKDTNIKVGLIIGQKTFQNELQSLVKKRLRGYDNLVDIVVATPGRLVDHINKTPGFDLRYLRFLVIDEADRMMEEVKQDWLTRVEQAVYTSTPGQGLYPHYTRPHPGHITASNAAKIHIPLQKLLFSATLSQNPEKLQQLKLFQPKLFTSVTRESSSVVSPKKDTRTKDVKNTDKHGYSSDKAADEAEDSILSSPTKSAYGTERGEFIGKYTTPTGLTEYFVESNTAEKPLMVVHFLRNLGYKNILCFTKSVEATHRLYLLTKLIGGIQVQEFSSKLHATKRNRIIQQFEAGKIHLLVCSDAMARGMDIGNVEYVISYDGPPFIKTYIHRVGRTARAGKPGTSITLLERKEIFHFKKMLKEAGKSELKEMRISRDELEPIVPEYTYALQKLPELLKTESKKRL